MQSESACNLIITRQDSESLINTSSCTAPAHPHGDFDPEKLYKLKSICGETATHYLIDWEDDPETGKKFKKSWEPKENVNAEAVEDWEYSRAEEKSKYRAVPAPPETAQFP